MANDHPKIKTQKQILEEINKKPYQANPEQPAPKTHPTEKTPAPSESTPAKPTLADFREKTASPTKEPKTTPPTK